jgi:hypothetical protein
VARKLEVLFIGDTSSLDKSFRKLDGQTDKSKGKLAGLGAGAAKFAGAAVGAGAAAGIVGGKLISLASDAEETASKFKTVFGKETRAVTKDLDAFSKATGTSKFALREQAAGFQALIRPMGLSTKNAAGMSKGMTKLATDLASFNNTSVEEAITALKSGLVGESEPMRRYGVQLSATRVQAFAYAKGIAKTGTELTAAQKAQASYGLILKDTELAQGDATRTAGSFANQWKRLKSQATDLATELGMKLLPVVTDVVEGITGFIAKLQSGGDAAGGLRDKVIPAWEKIQGAVDSVVGFIGGLLSDHRDDLDHVVGAVENLGKAITFVWENWTLPVIKRVLPAIRMIVTGVFDVIGGAVKVLSSLLTGRFGDAWDGVKQIFRGAIGIVLGLVRGATAPFREAFHRVGQAINAALDAAWGLVKDAVRGVVGWLGDRWRDLRTTAGNVWDGIKTAILTPIRAARDLLTDNIWPAIKDIAKESWEGIKTSLKNGGEGLLNVLLWPFKQAVKGIARFAKLILDVVGKIPGVDTSGPIKAIDSVVDGLAQGGTFQAFARGGAFARTGGLVDRPITLMGEEAPRHPEFVIPTNPAYRKRAQGLLAQAAGVIGFARGGIMSQAAIEGLARSVHMPNPHLMSAIAMAESSGDPAAHGPPDGRGLWQIEWPVWGRTMLSKGLDEPYKALENALMARVVLAEQGINAWVAYTSGSYQKFMDGGQTPVIGNLINALNPIDLIQKLPGVGDLPDWIQGLGKHVIGKVKDYITGALSFDRVGGKAGPGADGGVARAIQYAMSLGFPHPSDSQIGGGQHATGSLHYAGRAVDFGDAGQTFGKMQSLFLGLYDLFGSNLNELFYDRMPWFIDAHQRVPGQFGGHGDHIHAGFARGGSWGGLPYVGKFHDGGIAPMEGLAHVSKGERMTPAGGGIVLHAEIDLGRGIRERVRLEFDDRGRQQRGAWNAGVLPA